MSAPDIPALRMRSAAAASPPNPPPTICAFIGPLPGLRGGDAVRRRRFAPVRSPKTPASAQGSRAPARAGHAPRRDDRPSDKPINARRNSEGAWETEVGCGSSSTFRARAGHFRNCPEADNRLRRNIRRVGQSRLTRSGMVCLARPGADIAKEVGVRNGAPHVADDQREGNIPARTDITTLRAVAAGH